MNCQCGQREGEWVNTEPFSLHKLRTYLVHICFKTLNYKKKPYKYGYYNSQDSFKSIRIYYKHTVYATEAGQIFLLF